MVNDIEAMTINEIKSNLILIAKTIFSTVHSDNVRKEKVIFKKYDITDLSYYDGGTKGFGTKIKEIPQLVISDDDKIIVLKLIENSKYYEDCCLKICEMNNLKIDETKYHIKSYCNYILKNAFDPNIIKKLDKLVDAFIIYLSGDIERKAVVYIDGIVLKDKLYHLKNSIVLRQPCESDISLITRGNIFDLWLYKTYTSFLFATAILEFSYNSKRVEDAIKEMNIILDGLRLFKLQSIIAIQYCMNPEFVFEDSGLFYSDQNYTPFIKPNICANDINDIGDFLVKITPILKKYTDYDSNDNDNTYRLGSALERYRGALIGNVDIDSRITLAINCIELLYKTGTTEIPYRVKIYVSTFLKIFGFNPKQVYDNLVLAYDIRNAVSHGSRSRKLSINEKNRLCNIILEYARISLIIFLQLTKEERKKIIEDLLNDAIFNEGVDNIINIISNTIIVSGKEIKNKDIGYDDVVKMVDKKIPNLGV